MVSSYTNVMEEKSEETTPRVIAVLATRLLRRCKRYSEIRDNKLCGAGDTTGGSGSKSGEVATKT
jgi:hypothetical protein